MITLESGWWGYEGIWVCCVDRAMEGWGLGWLYFLSRQENKENCLFPGNMWKLGGLRCQGSVREDPGRSSNSTELCSHPLYFWFCFRWGSKVKGHRSQRRKALQTTPSGLHWLQCKAISKHFLWLVPAFCMVPPRVIIPMTNMCNIGSMIRRFAYEAYCTLIGGFHFLVTQVGQLAAP